MKRQIRSKLIMILARAMDHRIGFRDEDPPELPRLTVKEAMVSFFIRLTIVLANLVTCGFVIANVIRHW
jgi:hypothetical protein